MNNSKLTKEIIGYLLASGFKWVYETRDFSSVRKNISIHGRITPEEYINLPIIWRKSNMLEIKFINNKPFYIKVGNNDRYSKKFNIDDIGVKLKPIIHELDDKYNLISQGIAVGFEIIMK